MKKFFPTLLFIFCFSLPVLAQKPTPTATPMPEANEDVVKISTNLIQVDVTVTDRSGKVITDLKPEEFEIYENGEKQNITNFSFISSIKTQAEKPAPSKDKSAVPLPIPPTAIRPEQVKRTIALVVDDLTLSFESVYYVRRALKKFVDEQMQEGDLVAIIRTAGGAGALQQFTNDRRQLYAAIERIRWNPAGNGKVGAFAAIEPTPLERLKATGTEVSAEELEAERNRDQNFKDFQSSVFATGTLGALDYVVRGMQELPGRKSVMLLSDGFKLETKNETGFSERSIIFDALKRLIDAANRASVVVYTMDARGLQTLGVTAADDVSLLSGDQLEQRITDRRDELLDTQAGLVYLAKQTGGSALVNSNDLSGGIRKILDDQSYYLIGYQPDSETFDPKTRQFNKLQVKVNRKGAQVRYRSGFFGVSDEQIKKPSIVQTPREQIMNALTSPFAVNGIGLRLNTLFANDAKEGSYVRFLLHVDAKDLKFTDEKDGSKKAVFDVVAVMYGDNGMVADQVSQTYTFTTKGERYAKVLSDGFVYHFPFPVKKPGAYQLRVAIRDEQDNKVGSANQFVEVPNLKKNRLTVSGIVLENLTTQQWNKFMTNASASANTAESISTDTTNPMNDTSVRRFKRGTILRYGSEIYNAQLDAAQKPNLTTQIRMFRDGKLIFDGKQTPVELAGQTDLQRIKFVGAINLGTEMTAGDYVLQIVATDNLAKEKQKISTQFVQFEIIE
ncbi:MAG: VWA domain-containing protein [Acidobacteriota bacterium]|nr:VWA domain-containing protein [Acidobacteriota bacterium]